MISLHTGNAVELVGHILDTDSKVGRMATAATSLEKGS